MQKELEPTAQMDKLRILLCHNFYQQPGGEDQVFTAEKTLLQSQGHEVIEYTDNNDRLETMTRLSAARQTIWSASSYQAVIDLVDRKKPDIAHFHNTFLLISPSAYYACHKRGVPVVQSLHNYRLFCLPAIFYRDGRICEDCLGKSIPWPGVYHRCYRNSRSQSAVVAALLSTHRSLQTWQNKVAIYIASSEFSRQKFIQGGLPAKKILVKPNFVAEPVASASPAHLGHHVLFLGRLSREKGLTVLLAAWKKLSDIPLKIIGDGPLRDSVLERTQNQPAVNYLGYLAQGLMKEMMRSARMVILPSVCYENFPIVIAEAFALGVPVIASRLGTMAEVVRDGESGLLFNAGDADDLAAKVRWLWDHPGDSARMGRSARLEYEQKYTPERNYDLLIEIYSKAMRG